MAKKPEKELGGSRNMSTGTKIIVGIFAVIMALSMMLPSLAPIFASNNASNQAEAASDNEDAKDIAQAEDEETDAKPSVADVDLPTIPDMPENDTFKNLAEQYASGVEKFEKRLEEDPNNLAALLNLGQDYMNWGYSATYSSSTDEETAYSKALINRAKAYYQRYLSLRDSDAVKVQLALCDYYLGNTDEAIASLTAMTEKKPDYPLGWANLGMLYEQQYDYDKALEAFQKAVDTDPNDEYGAKTYGEGRIASINASRSDFSDLTNQDVLGTNSAPAEGLAGVIAEESGI